MFVISILWRCSPFLLSSHLKVIKTTRFRVVDFFGSAGVVRHPSHKSLGIGDGGVEYIREEICDVFEGIDILAGVAFTINGGAVRIFDGKIGDFHICIPFLSICKSQVIGADLSIIDSVDKMLDCPGHLDALEIFGDIKFLNHRIKIFCCSFYLTQR